MDVQKVLTGGQIEFEDLGMQSVEGEHPKKKYRILRLGDVTTLGFWSLSRFLEVFPRMEKGNEISLQYKDRELLIQYYTRDEQEYFAFNSGV